MAGPRRCLAIRDLLEGQPSLTFALCSDPMRTLTPLAAVLLVASISAAQEKSLSGPAPRDRAGTNESVEAASASYARASVSPHY